MLNKILENYLAVIRKILPRPKAFSSVGLDIGLQDCKLIEIVKNSETYELLTMANEPIVKGDLRLALENILGKIKQPCKAPYSSLFGKGTLIRYITMPRMPLEELRNCFGIEADKYFPFPQDQITTDCFILDSQGQGKEMSVMAGAVRKELIEQRVKLFQELGYEVEFIGLNAAALANVLYVFGFDEEKEEKKEIPSAVALFDMGESVSSLTITVNRMPQLTRDIFIGGRDFTKRVSNVLGLTLEEAEALKKNPGDKKAAIVSACETALSQLIQELKLSFDYFATERGVSVDRLLLTGGASMLDGLPEAFRNNFEIKTTHWNPLAKLKLGPDIDPVEFEKKSFKFGVALGLGLYRYD